MLERLEPAFRRQHNKAKTAACWGMYFLDDTVTREVLQDIMNLLSDSSMCDSAFLTMVSTRLLVEDWGASSWGADRGPAP